MASMTDYLNKLVMQKNTLVDNLVTKGVEATHDETLETLVPKILNISGGAAEANYVEDGLICFSDLTDYLIFNPITDDKLGCKVNNCDGTNGYAAFSKPDVTSQLSTTFTLQVLCCTTAAGSWGEVFGVIYSSSNRAATIGINSDGCLCSSINGSAISSTTVVNDGIWHLLAVTYSDNTLKLFVDGTNVMESSVTINIPSNASIYIGQWLSNMSKFIGQSTNACIYNRALSAEEVFYNWQIDVKRYKL